MFADSARQIFERVLLRIDAKQAVRRAVRIEGSRLLLGEKPFEIAPDFSVYVIAVGKAAYPMAESFNEIAGAWVRGGVVSGILPAKIDLGEKWRHFSGGHPLPNEESLAAARAGLKMLEQADAERALIVFLISGGGSAMMELPRDDSITLADLREFNRILVTCGAPINEINAVRRAISSVKGGGLALRAPNAAQISLIISDTSAGDITSVASGPSLLPGGENIDPGSVIAEYDLAAKLPVAVMATIENSRSSPVKKLDSRVCVLLDNRQMVGEAARIAAEMGFVVGIDEQAEDELIDDGCRKLFARFVELRRSVAADSPVCLISGGEFGCPVVGKGTGGRNSETVLRLLLAARDEKTLSEFAVLSAGTDGIDGNSPAAGAVADQTTLGRAQMQGSNPAEYLQNSDSFTFFDKLGASLVTGATGTNVRDLRILIG